MSMSSIKPIGTQFLNSDLCPLSVFLLFSSILIALVHNELKESWSEEQKEFFLHCSWDGYLWSRCFPNSSIHNVQ